ncbi:MULTISPECIES: copper resistance CopC family protein [unclassified Halomonas]|uniref:copper resistance CopC family protein n=1 Tax=Halomonas sp. IOP_14 TaxID=2873295 RepID=UPI001E29868B|nr:MULTISPECIES: copper resistance protein CopC [unclassified Halomonas]MCD1587365.1 copper resistance protein CopC [Halomonas sp. IOP_14]UTD54539.1 copper resistance protein CopC [Halomonas sp. MS1]
MQKKKSSLPIIHASLATLLMSLAIPALAHEGRVNTLPRDGVTIQDSPAEIGIEFGGMMRITQFEVTGPNGPVPLDGQPGSEQVERYVVKPGEILSAGDYQVHWRGLSDDGHMMSDGFNFSVEP